MNFVGSSSVKLISPVCRSASLWFCFTMDLREKDVKITRNSML
jgi:hypothetical protein